MNTLHQAMAHPGIAIGLAALAAVCFAGAAVLQHRAVTAEHTPGGHVDPHSRDGLTRAGLVAAARTPGWLFGLALAAGGTTLHALALVLAPLSVVQPIGVLAVPIAVLISMRRTHRRPTAGVVVGVVLAVTGVAVFVLTAAGSATSTPAADSAMALAGAIVALVVVAFAALGLARSGWVRCVALATGGAVAFGLVSALMRAVSQLVTTGASAIISPAVLTALGGLVAALLAGGWLVQQAFAAGAPEVVVACMTVVDPIVAVLLGVVLLGEGASTPVVIWLQLLVAAGLAVVGVVALASHHPDALARREAAALAGVPATRPAPRSASRSSVGSGSRREHVLHRR
ncbi:hypothetical protein SAMN05443637_11362 [Pseudonocardia thermophila]|jgi:hypothetical protein|uniref:Magnesium transporter NIPA n=1 Tax=Pseudonocardia thermophila TaxID=1848 RepID=A0A1M6VUK0_PSETH|nr:hypothetical protein [Pseudonocardia thermophila]SHK85138.1 hypothetical protein SAMN05443637_11362 [Pseudonocardia thermophila]